MNPQGAFAFLIGYACDIYIFIVLTRFILQLVKADFYNPISQFIVRATNPPLVPLRRIIPGAGGMDIASLVLVLALLIIKVIILSLLISGSFSASPQQFLLYLFASLAKLLLNYVFWAVILRVILSWVAPDPRNPGTAIVIQVTEPIMAPVRKLLPPMGGLDLSPIIILIGIQFLQILLGI